MVSRKGVVILTVLLLVLGSSSAWAQYNESPMLQELVEAGVLPPVEQRLPAEPLVIEPVHGIGEYGGTWYSMAPPFGWFGITRMSMYGHSPVRWVDDGLGIEPNWVQSWESNDDATIWTLHMRQGIRWSDGVPFSGHDFMFWWEDMALDPEMSETVPDMFIAGGRPADISLVDDFTIQIEFAQPAPLLLQHLAIILNTGIAGPRLIVPAHYLIQFHPRYTEDYQTYETLEDKADWTQHLDSPLLTEWIPVAHAPGEYVKFERNPYYYAVDPDGNQLPYIDHRHVSINMDYEVLQLHLMDGQMDFHLRPYLGLTALTAMLENQEAGDYEVLQWSSGSGTGPMFFPNWNHPDEARRELYREPDFLRALSLAINRGRIQNTLFFGLGRQTTGTLSAKAVEYTRHPQGSELFDEWVESYVAFDPERAKGMLDALGVVDLNGDGWRDMPDGEPLTLRVDYSTEADQTTMMTTEMVKADWEDIGLKVDMNPLSNEMFFMTQMNASFDVMNSWEVGDGPDHIVYPQWIVPIDGFRWAPLYGSWYQQMQFGTAHDQDELEPRDRMPPREQPDPEGPVARLQALYDRAKLETDESVRDDLAMQMVRIHIDEGPFFIGTVADLPQIVVRSNAMRNVPYPEDLAQGGFVNPFIMSYPAIVNPAQFWLDR